METKRYTVARIDGDHAWLNRTDAEAAPSFIARALLPCASANGSSAAAMGKIDDWTGLKRAMLQYDIV